MRNLFIFTSIWLIMMLVVTVKAEPIVYTISTYEHDQPSVIDSVNLINYSTGKQKLLKGFSSSSFDLVMSEFNFNTSTNEDMKETNDLELLTNVPGQMQLLINSPYSQEYNIFVFNTKGQLEFQQTITTLKGANSITIKLPENEIFLIRAHYNGKSKTFKALGNTQISEFSCTLTGSTIFVKNRFKSATIQNEILPYFSAGDTVGITAYLKGYYCQSQVYQFSESKKLSFNFEKNILVDVDGNRYKTVKIGDQTWMAENLKVTRWDDGFPLAYINPDSENIPNRDNGAPFNYYSYYDKDLYGLLYFFSAGVRGSHKLSSGQGACPTGWVVPSDTEWRKLEMHLGMSEEDSHKYRYEYRGENTGAYLKSKSGWKYFDYYIENYDSIGFNALPGGGLQRYYFYQNDVEKYGHWWATGFVRDNIYGQPKTDLVKHTRSLSFQSNGIRRAQGDIYMDALSIRCIKSIPKLNVPPTKPHILSQVTNEKTSAKLYGKIKSNGNSAITECGFLLSTSPDLSSPDVTEIINYSIGKDIYPSRYQNPFRSDVSDLLTETNYYFVAYATNAIGTSYGDTIQFRTTDSNKEVGSLTDYDGNTYETVKIGDNWWMAEDLRVKHFSDGASIPLIENMEDWKNLNVSIHEKAMTNVNTSTLTGKKPVVLYNFGAAVNGAPYSRYGEVIKGSYYEYEIQSQGVCPDGWHLPTKNDWQEMSDYLIENGYSNNGGQNNSIAKSLSDSTTWYSYSAKGVIGNQIIYNNRSGFSALPNGFRRFDTGDLQGLLTNALYWTAENVNVANANSVQLNYKDSLVNKTISHKNYAFSVRCVKNTENISYSTPILKIEDSPIVTDVSVILYTDIITHGGYEIKACKVEVSTSMNFEIENTFTYSCNLTDNVISQTISGLESNSSYYYRFSATNKLGTVYGNVSSFTTLKAGESNQVMDIEGNIYQVIKIGDKWWMAENLKTAHFADGTPISLIGVEAKSSWARLNDINDEMACTNREIDKYGMLYTFGAAVHATPSTPEISVQGVCPDGWHIPNNEEWQELNKYNIPESFFQKSFARSSYDGNFTPIENYWWTSNEQSNVGYLVGYYQTKINLNTQFKSAGFPVRCTKNPE